MSVGCNLPDPLPGGPISMLPSCPVKLHGSDRASVLPTKRGGTVGRACRTARRLVVDGLVLVSPSGAAAVGFPS